MPILPRSQPGQEPVGQRFYPPGIPAVLGEFFEAPSSSWEHVGHVVGRCKIHDLPARFDVPRAAPCGIGSSTTGLISAVAVLAADVVAAHLPWQVRVRQVRETSSCTSLRPVAL